MTDSAPREAKVSRLFSGLPCILFAFCLSLARAWVGSLCVFPSDTHCVRRACFRAQPVGSSQLT